MFKWYHFCFSVLFQKTLVHKSLLSSYYNIIFLQFIRSERCEGSFVGVYTVLDSARNLGEQLSKMHKLKAFQRGKRIHISDITARAGCASRLKACLHYWNTVTMLHRALCQHRARWPFSFTLLTQCYMEYCVRVPA